MSKIVTTKVTYSALAAADGGFAPAGNNAFVVVECPDDYRTDEIDAGDILADASIRTLTSAEIGEIEMVVRIENKIPAGAIAYKWEDPEEEARFVFDQADFDEIRREDPSLLVRLPQQ